jgi:hypothetical protein
MQMSLTAFLKYTLVLLAIGMAALLLRDYINQREITYESQTVEDGRGNKTDVKVSLELNTIKLKSEQDRENIQKMIWDTEFWAKDKCRNPVSFKPYEKSSFFVSRNDTGYTVSLNYLAANAYGSEGELTALCYFDTLYHLTHKF